VADILGLSVYLWIMIVSLAGLVIVFVVGDLGGGDGGDGGNGGDGDGGFSPLSLPMATIFGVSFGGMGVLLEAGSLNPLAVAFGAALFAFGIAAAMYFVVVRAFVRTQAETKVVLTDLVGSPAQVTIPAGPGLIGQILVITDARGRTLIPAVANERINTEEIVVIREVIGSAVRIERKVGE